MSVLFSLTRVVGLAERRDRRRARKEIVDPKPVLKEARKKTKRGKRYSSEEESIEDERPLKRKGRRSKVAPGIALMENFTAVNVTKSRLTVCVLLS